jgi:hypothetical protein
MDLGKTSWCELCDESIRASKPVEDRFRRPSVFHPKLRSLHQSPTILRLDSKRAMIKRLRQVDRIKRLKRAYYGQLSKIALEVVHRDDLERHRLISRFCQWTLGVGSGQVDNQTSVQAARY